MDCGGRSGTAADTLDRQLGHFWAQANDRVSRKPIAPDVTRFKSVEHQARSIVAS